MDRIEQEAANLLGPLAGHGLVVATSGGPDSQVLLAVLAALRPVVPLGPLWAVGIDHGLRSEARQELDLAEALARQLEVPFARRAVTVTPTGNRLAQARRARYQALQAFRHQYGAHAVAIGHTATDQLETMLMHLCRGSGLRGAGGFRPRTRTLVRPLHGVSRDAVLDYANRHRLQYAEDPSNLDLNRTRARLRSQVLPVLRTINPQVERAWGAFAQAARDDARHLEVQAERWLAKHASVPWGLNTSQLRRQPRPLRRCIIATWMRRHRLVASRRLIVALDRMVIDGSGVTTAAQGVIRCEHDHLWVSTTSAVRSYSRPFPIPSEQVIEEIGVRLRAWRFGGAPPQGWQDERQMVAFDADRLHFNLQVRAWKHGDRLRPFGRKGHIKVGDLFTNNKVPKALRPVWPVITHGDDILWVVGLRRSAWAPLTPASRHKVALAVVEARPPNA